MPISNSTSAEKKSISTPSSGQEDAIALLTKDHADVKELFDTYQQLADDEASATERQEVAEQICEALTAHATVEEEIFYPALREAADDASDELDEAEVEHASVKDLIAQIQSMDADDDLYDAKVKVLGEYVQHHVQEEEGEMFPKAQQTSLDMEELGAQMKARKEELLDASLQ